jgi:preprotein translocase SecE subunit
MAMGLLLWASLSKLLAALAYAVDAPDAAIFGSSFTVTTLVAMIVAAGGAVYAFKNERVYGFSEEVITELHKVVWPGKKETQTAVVVVIVTTLVVAMILGVFDWAWATLTGLIY